MTGEHREIFDCERISAYLDSYLEGQVPPPEARAMRLHIHACSACREQVLKRDPLQLFAPLADEERGEEFWAGFWPAVRADIHAAEAEATTWSARLLRPALAWGAAAAMFLVAVLALLRPGPVEQERRNAFPAGLVNLPEAARTGGPSLPTVEQVRSPSARVLSMKVFGEGEAVTELVLIVDEEIQL